MIRKALIAFTVLLLLPLAALAGDANIKGSFTLAEGKDFKFDGKTVEVMEFMSFYCGHCYEFEKAIPAIKGTFPKKTSWKILPIHWGQGSSKPAEAYFIAVDAGKGEQMKAAIFRANFVEKKNIGSLEVLEALASEVGLGFDFSRKLRGGEKAKDVEAALRLASIYNVEETPTLVIANNIMTNGHLSGHDLKAFKDNVITIIRSILKG